MNRRKFLKPFLAITGAIGSGLKIMADGLGSPDPLMTVSPIAKEIPKCEFKAPAIPVKDHYKILALNMRFLESHIIWISQHKDQRFHPLTGIHGYGALVYYPQNDELFILVRGDDYGCSDRRRLHPAGCLEDLKKARAWMADFMNEGARWLEGLEIKTFDEEGPGSTSLELTIEDYCPIDSCISYSQGE